MTDPASIARGMTETMSEIFAIVKPANPEPANWLDSDACASYCYECVVKARGRKFELGPVLAVDKPFYRRTEMEDAFFRDISGGYYGQAEHDHTEECYTCGKQLAYTLTTYGAQEESAYWLETELMHFGPDEAYALDRLFMVTTWTGDDDESQQLASDVLAIAERVRAYLKEQEQ